MDAQAPPSPRLEKNGVTKPIPFPIPIPSFKTSSIPTYSLRTAEMITCASCLFLLTAAIFRITHAYGSAQASINSGGVLLLAVMTIWYPVSMQLLAHFPAARMWSYFTVLACSYFGLGLIAKEFPSDSFEKSLLALDLAIGFDVYRLTGDGIVPWLAEILGFGYLFYFPYCIGRAYHIIKPMNAKTERFFLAIVIVYSAGFFGYAFAPALGPRYAAPGTFPVTGPLIAPMAVFLVDKLGSPWAVMPSMHVAASTLVLLFDALYNRKWAVLCFVPTVILWCATMGLGFHYGIDVLVGLALSAVSLWLAHKLPIWTPLPSPRRMPW